ncbi:MULTISPECIES: hypothetical protein [Streptomyces]|uniref:Tetratricopeptide repeat protein n=1 Tax=Streptomyces sudanensis TaxID=436397 RepID=A0ABY4TCA3_9ACTN|nr:MULTISPECIES: hypothetical protein [Streptomyces]URN14620.1 hypothetical protein MW084_00330 [Streptomyces sudanensis]
MAPIGRMRAERLRRRTAEAYERAIAHQRTPGREAALRALEAFGEAHRSLGQLLERHPEDRELWHMRGALLYSEASSQLAAGLRSEAIASLNGCEEAYRRGAHPDGGVLAADAAIRRARAHSQDGNALSALADVDAAITAYVREGAFASPHPRLADFARVLALASTVHLASGDRDQALACARQSLARYGDLMAAAQGRLPADHLGYAIGMAGDTATRLEAARGNWSAALSVDALVLQVAEQGWGSLGAALARRGLHLRLAGRPREAEPLLVRAERESPGSVAREEETAALASPPTFGEALAAAESLMRGQPRPAVSPRDVGLLREALTAHESYSATSRLVRPAALPAQAAQLVALADCLVREGEAARAWRVAAETHLMCRAVMRCTDGSAPGRPPGLATSWCGALEVGARAALAMEEQSLLRDMKDTVRAVYAFLGPGPQDACRELLEEALARLDAAPPRPSR